MPEDLALQKNNYGCFHHLSTQILLHNVFTCCLIFYGCKFLSARNIKSEIDIPLYFSCILYHPIWYT